MATARGVITVQIASNIESHLVKPLHPIDEIAARISQADGDGVRLTRGASSKSLNGLTALVDPVAAVMQALAEPLDFPPLAAGIVPGDRVAIAIDSTVPCVAKVVRGVMEALQSAGVELPDISIVTADSQTSTRCREELEGSEEGPLIVIHDPADDNSLCLVGTMKRGEPLLVTREIFDADVILPISCARVNNENAFVGLFPQFTGAEMLNYYRAPVNRESVANRQHSETDEAGRLIGVLMSIQVVPGRGETVSQVVAGEPHAVARRCEALCREEWSLRSPERVSLLIATVTGGTASQTWANVGRALEAAENVVEEDGVVAICTNLEEQPGHSLGRLVRNSDIDRAARKIFHDSDADSWPAWQVARALQRGAVYFLSQLSDETVEDLGMAPVESVDDIVRLAGRHGSFAVLEDAQHAAVTVGSDDHDE
ncbi:MAG TPA: lactate racemase domain-containing protein [Lacipirellulaceae bacterium]|jgi:nickel-dependent lactate racemase|nr:lactate racemase domain-containing protein [Lacipirellulaceae bacterium]